jgi:hypothetical protein
MADHPIGHARQGAPLEPEGGSSWHGAHAAGETGRKRGQDAASASV